MQKWTRLLDQESAKFAQSSTFLQTGAGIELPILGEHVIWDTGCLAFIQASFQGT
jgi:hypothetical protein